MQENSDFLTRDDLEEFCYLLLVGGIETSVNLITNSLCILGDSPDLFQRLRAHPEELPKYIDEVLRFRSPVQSAYRVAAKHSSLGGNPFVEGNLSSLG